MRTMHEVPVRCVGVSVVLLKKIDHTYKVLLMKRNSSVLQDEWCYIGGGIEEGEKAWEAALREVREETGIKLEALYTSNKFEQFYSYTEEYIYMAPVFVGYVSGDQEVTLNDEHKQYEWLDFNDAIERVTLPGNDDVLDFVEKHFVSKKPSDWLLVYKER